MTFEEWEAEHRIRSSSLIEARAAYYAGVAAEREAVAKWLELGFDHWLFARDIRNGVHIPQLAAERGDA